MEIDEAKRQKTAGARPESRTRTDAERVWRLVTRGGRESISSANEDAVRKQLSTLCNALHASHAQKLAMLASIQGADPEAIRIVQQVLYEEQRIAELVCISAEKGDAW